MKAITKNVTPRNTATPVIRWMKCSISRDIGVWPTSRPDARLAMRPITVRSPVKITIPRHVPAPQPVGTLFLKIQTSGGKAPTRKLFRGCSPDPSTLSFLSFPFFSPPPFPFPYTSPLSHPTIPFKDGRVRKGKGLLQALIKGQF